MYTAPPMFSLIVPARLCPRRVRSLVRVLAGQTYGDWEMLVAVDDDKTAENIYRDAISMEPRARLAERNRWNTGPGAARNDAVAQSRGRYIVMLDADDSLRKDYLGRFAEFFATHPHIKAALAPTRIVLDAGPGLRKPLFVPNLAEGLKSPNGTLGVVTMAGYERLIVSTHVVCHSSVHLPWPENGFAEDVVRDARLVVQAKTVPVMDTEYLALIHRAQYTQSGHWSEEAIRASYVRTATQYPELASMFLRRATANAYFANNRRAGEDWYVFWSERHGEVPELEELVGAEAPREDGGQAVAQVRSSTVDA